jgi:hypothetical protein
MTTSGVETFAAGGVVDRVIAGTVGYVTHQTLLGQDF